MRTEGVGDGAKSPTAIKLASLCSPVADRLEALGGLGAGPACVKPHYLVEGTVRMEMQQVRYFIALAGTLNFTRAAEKCNVSQPALTRAIKLLEIELGGPLFHRERGKTHLSELGRMMLPYLQTIEEQCRAAKDQARAVQRLERTTLAIGTMCTIGPRLVSDLMIRFPAAYPDIDVRAVDADTHQMIAMLESGELEVAMVGVPDELPETLHQLPIFEERFVIILPPGHSLCEKKFIRAADLDQQPFVSRVNCEAFDAVHQELMQRGVFPRQIFSSPRDDWVQGMVKAGLGLAFFPELSVTDPDLTVRPLVEPNVCRTIYLATVRGRPHSPAVGAFIGKARRYSWPTTLRAA